MKHRRKFRPKVDVPGIIIILALGGIAVWLAWNSGPVAAIWPAAQ